MICPRCEQEMAPFPVGKGGWCAECRGISDGDGFVWGCVVESVDIQWGVSNRGGGSLMRSLEPTYSVRDCGIVLERSTHPPSKIYVLSTEVDE